jgi:DMSO/TMAO reductase YedYZ heme-binding membrane subunit
MESRPPTARRTRRIWPLGVAIAACLFVGFWGWVYQGYIEDAGMDPVQSWPVGAGGFGAAFLLALRVLCRLRPGMPRRRIVLVAIALAVALVAAAAGSIDAGNG